MALPVPQPLQDATEALAALLAFVLTANLPRRIFRHVFRRDHHLRRQVERRVASLAASSPFKMQLEQTHLSETFAALGAEEGSFSGVNALVSGQIPGVLETLFTFLAGVRTLSRVGPLVTGNVRGTREGFAALLARVRVGSVVYGERLGESRALDLLLGGTGHLCSSLEFAELLRVTLLDVLQQVGLLHVEERTFGASEDLGGHLHCGTYTQYRKEKKYN